MTGKEFNELKDRLWEAADKLRANSSLTSHEYKTPVLGLIFLKFADNKYAQREMEILQEYEQLKGSRREKTMQEIAASKDIIYLPPEARYDYLLSLPESENHAETIKKAMELIEKSKPELEGVLPKNEYFDLVDEKSEINIHKELLRTFSNIPIDASGDVFGKIYEYFLGKFALKEGQGGGEFFTPNSVVRLMVEIIEPHDGTVYDPACGSGGMFVQSAKFVDRRKQTDRGYEDSDLYVYGQEKTGDTVKLAKMNLAVNGLRGEISSENTYYNDPFESFGKFDYVLANPPFNVDEVVLAKVEGQKRFNEYGIPRNKTKNKSKGEETCPNANYLWINLFATSLKKSGRAGLVMANSASDARHSEADIRQKLIENNIIYSMVTLPSNMFYTVTLPATLWFFDKAKTDDKILFIDARNIFTQIDRAHREFSEEQIQNISVITRLHRGKRKEYTELVHGYFEKGSKELNENRENIKKVSAKVVSFLKQINGSDIPNLAEKLPLIDALEKSFNGYVNSVNHDDADKANESQKALYEEYEKFFHSLHEMLKTIDKQVRKYEKTHTDQKETKILKQELEELHKGVKSAEYFYKHIGWLQERFPSAKYEDVTGLCKLATQEEVKEQDYSLNSGRYVGVVIEEDGKTEEEFIEEILDLNAELEKLNNSAKELEAIISHNIKQIAGDE